MAAEMLQSTRIGMRYFGWIVLIVSGLIYAVAGGAALENGDLKTMLVVIGIAIILIAIGVGCIKRLSHGPSATLGAILLLVMPVIFCLIVGPFVASRGQLQVRMSNEGATKGNLGMLRSALSDYQKAHSGHNPDSLDLLEYAGQRIGALPKVKAPPYHPDSSAVFYSSSPTDSGGWLYDADSGQVLVNCTHTDSKGTAWTAY